MSNIRSAFRNHLPFIVVVGLLLVLMTWPTIVYVFETGTFWLASDNRDVWQKLWDAWHVQKVRDGEASLDFADTLFHPVGMSIVYSPDNVFYTELLAMLQPWMGTSNAFNLLYLLIILATTLSAYVYLIYLFKHRWLALFGAVVFGFSQHVVEHPQHPDLNLLITIPLALYALQRGMDEGAWQWTLLSGVLVGITAFIGMYMFVCLLLTMGIITVLFAYRAWRQARFWIGMALLLSAAASISLIRVVPMVRDSSALEDVLRKSLGQEYGNDVLSYFVSGGHPWLTPAIVKAFDLGAGGELDFRWQHTSSYLGYLPLLLIALGFSAADHRRKMIPWLILLMPFLILRLGSALRVNGVLYPEILLPKHFLNAVFPLIFQPFYATDHFQIGILLPWAVLSCFGLDVLLKSVSRKHRALVAIGAVALLAFEYYQPPISQVIPKSQLAFNDWLRNEPNQDDIRLINLPMGRRSSKIYVFYQTVNGYPQAEGLAYRTPEKSYSYILQNYLLAAWHKGENPFCSFGAFDRYLADVEQLLDDGFSHVIHHHKENQAYSVADSFESIAPAYQDEYVSIYRLTDLRDLCYDRITTYQNQLPALKGFLHSPVSQPRADVSLIHLYPADYYSNEAMRYYAAQLWQWKDLIHIAHDEEGAAQVTDADAQHVELDRFATENDMFWLLYSPGLSQPRGQGQFAAWLLRKLRYCKQIYRGEDLIVELYIDRAYSCDLVLMEGPLKLRYDNGIELVNLLTESDAKQLSVDLWWQRDGIRGFAYTIQIFDVQGYKHLQIDQGISSRPLSRATFDISGLDPGDYVAKLIVYKTASGQSQGGVIQGTQQAFERELEIARFSVPG